jgi:isopenicillin N synthase-like dioxygenase
VTAGPHLPIVDIGPLIDPSASAIAVEHTAAAIDRACREIGFFGIVGHGVEPTLQLQLERSSHEFFALPEQDKGDIAMARSGRAWRGWFPVGDELTAGRPDGKEGIYFGVDHPDDHPRVRAGAALHGVNQYPTRPGELGPLVSAWMREMREVAEVVLRGIAVGLGLRDDWFAANLTADPTVLFRIFHYPPSAAIAADDWGVAEHTDYGLLTILAQDDLGGLEVAARDGSWIRIDPVPGTFVCNLGDMLERLTAGRYRSTPHRVRNTSSRGRVSFPYFFDPSWDATVPTHMLSGSGSVEADEPHHGRWDGADVLAWEGTYGDYLTAKVAKVFPDLFTATAADTSREPEAIRAQRSA